MDEAKPFIESSPGPREKGACDRKSSFAQIEASERQQSPKQPVQSERWVVTRSGAANPGQEQETGGWGNTGTARYSTVTGNWQRLASRN